MKTITGEFVVLPTGSRLIKENGESYWETQMGEKVKLVNCIVHSQEFLDSIHDGIYKTPNQTKD